MRKQALSFYVLLAVVIAVIALGGCSGGQIDDDNGYDPGDENYPQYKDLTLILRIQTSAGKPLGGATVLIDEEEDSTSSDSKFHPLGDGYPTAWLGWLCNWTSDDYQVVMNYYGDRDSFEIRVHKDGWTDDSTIVRVDDSEPDQIFIRDTMVLHRLTDTASLKRVPHYAEVTAGPHSVKRQHSGKPRTIISGTDDRVNGQP
jgi:hypothetical protein